MTVTCFHSISLFKRKGVPLLVLIYSEMFSALTSVWDQFPPNNGSPWSLSALTQTTCLFYEAQYFHEGCRCISRLYWTHCFLTVFVHSKLWTEAFSQEYSVLLRTSRQNWCVWFGGVFGFVVVGFFSFIFFLFFFLSYYWLVLFFHCFDSVTQIIFCTCMNTLCMDQNLQKQEDGVRVQEKWPSCIFFFGKGAGWGLKEEISFCKKITFAL